MENVTKKRPIVRGRQFESNYSEDMSDFSRKTELEDGMSAAPGNFTTSDFRWSPWETVLWTILTALITFGALFLAFFFALVLKALQLGEATQDLSSDDYEQLMIDVALESAGFLTLVQFLVMIAMVLLLTRPKLGYNRGTMLAVRGKSLAAIAVWSVLAIVFTVIPSALLEAFVEVPYEDVSDWMWMLGPAWLGVILLVVMAPLGEELLFRGFLFGGLMQSRLGPLGAILVTSVLWSVIHIQYDWMIVGVIFVIGIVLGAVRWLSGSLWPPIVAHGVMNALAAAQFYGGFEAY